MIAGFKKQELKLQVDNQTHIVVSGERQVRENKYKRFEQSFELPKNADIEKITGKLDGEILYISVPKKVEQEHQEIKHGSNIHGGEREVFHEAPEPGSHEDDEDEEEEDDSDKKSEPYENEDESDNKKDLERKNPRRDSEEDWRKEADLFLRLAIEKLRKNKGIVMTAIFAFSLGVLVTQKLQSNGQ